jgi:hypothetical protein
MLAAIVSSSMLMLTLTAQRMSGSDTDRKAQLCSEKTETVYTYMTAGDHQFPPIVLPVGQLLALGSADAWLRGASSPITHQIGIHRCKPGC